MALICKKLVTDTMLDEVLCVCSGCRPVKTYTEGLAYKGPGCTMVTSEAGMDFSQEVPPFLLGDTSLKYPGSAFLIELSLMDFVGFRAPHNAACLILILGESVPIKVGQEGFGPWGDNSHDEMGRGCYFGGRAPDYVSVFGFWGCGRIQTDVAGLPCHTTDGLNILSRKMLGGTGSCLAPMRARTSAT